MRQKAVIHTADPHTAHDKIHQKGEQKITPLPLPYQKGQPRVRYNLSRKKALRAKQCQPPGQYNPSISCAAALSKRP